MVVKKFKERIVIKEFCFLLLTEKMFGGKKVGLYSTSPVICSRIF